METKSSPTVSYAKLPLSFEPNRGQTDSRVKFLSRGPGYTLFLTSNEVVLRLKGSEQPAVLRLKLVGANPDAKVVGLEGLPGRSNYFLGNDPSKWRTNMPHYSRVRFENIYPGIDLVYYGTEQGQLEYDFIVHPGADPAAIQLEVDGADRLRVSDAGNLVLTVPDGELKLRRPVVYQETEAGRVPIPGRYVLRGRRVGFELASYDRSRPLVIDPVLSYSTYLGGTGAEGDSGTVKVALDLSGNAYVAGMTRSLNFPTTGGVFQPSVSDPQNVFVTKFTPAGALVYSTFLGGSGFDVGLDIAADSAGNAYVAGITSSGDFPTANAFQPVLNNPPTQNTDLFVTKLNPSGTALLYSTYLGGSDCDGCAAAVGLAIDPAGHAYVASNTLSPNFPLMNPLQSTLRGHTDAVIAKLAPSGSALVYSTYLGGTGTDDPGDIAVDTTGNAYVTGFTTSLDFPTANPFQAVCGGGSGGGCIDAFLTKLTPTGSALVYSTYLGTRGDDFASAIAVDSAGSAYVSGVAPGPGFPTTPGAFLPNCCGPFVAKFNPSGSALVYSTFFPANVFDIAVDGAGRAYLTGIAFAGQPVPFPLVNPIQSVMAGSTDPIIAVLNLKGSALVFSTFLGGNEVFFQGAGGDGGRGVATDGLGNIWATGVTNAGNFPTVNAAQPLFAGGTCSDVPCLDVFVARINDAVVSPVPVLSSLVPPSAVVGGTSFTLTVVGSAFTPDSVVRWNGSDRETTFISSTMLTVFVPASDLAATGSAQVTVFNPAPGGGTSNSLVFNIVNPVPTISSLSPTSQPVGSAGFTLTVNGSSFINGSEVRWNGSDRNTTFLSGTTLTASIPASDLVNAGTAQVTVFNPAPGGGTSNALSFNILSPVISNLVPDIIPATSPQFELTVKGSNFHTGSVVRWKGMDRTTMFVSSSQLKATILNTDVAAVGTAQVTVLNSAGTGGTSNAVTFTINFRNPLPTVTGLSLPGAVAGASGFMLGVSGSNFVFNSEVRWDGATRATTFLSSSQLQALIPATDLEMADIGAHPVTVLNPGPGGGTSNALNFNVLNMPNPPPMLASIDPTEVVAGSVRDTLPLTLTGANFINGSIVRWNGMSRLTSFISANQLLATIPASDLVSAGSASVTVFTPGPSGGASAPLMFTVNNPAPVLSSLLPNSAVEGEPGFTLTVVGSNFLPGSVVRWNGATRPTTFIGSSQLRAAILPDDLATAGMANVTVVNAAPGGGQSNALPFTIDSPPHAVTGPSSTAPQQPRSTTHVPPTPATQRPAAESTPSMVAAPAAPPTRIFTPIIDALRPAFVVAGSAVLRLTVYGENFTAESVVRWRGKDLPTKFVSSTELEVEVPAEALAQPGELKLTVFTPGPASGSSKPATLQVHPR